jgi:hypothetical protein
MRQKKTIAWIFNGTANVSSLSAKGIGGEGRGEVAREIKLLRLSDG